MNNFMRAVEMNRYIYIIFFLCSSCSFMRETKREITINSSPEGSEVSYLSDDTREFKTLGQTPLAISSEQIKEWKNQGKEFVAIRLQKSGHVGETVLLDFKGRYNVKYEAELKPVDIWNNKEEEVSSSAANKLATKVQSINQLILQKNFDSALQSTEGLIDQFPRASVFYDIKGSILFLMGKNDAAHSSYQKSLSLNPDNSSAKMMLDKIKGRKE